MSDIIIATERDKLDTEVIIKFCDKIGGSPVMPFLLRELAKLMESGHTSYSLLGFNNNSKALYVEIDRKIVSVSVFVLSGLTGWNILQSTNSQYRERGLSSRLHHHRELMQKKLGLTTLAGFVHKDNVFSLDYALEKGYIEVSRPGAFPQQEIDYIRVEKYIG